MIKVVLTGSESTGKTELAHALGERLDAPVAEEFVRRFAQGRDGRIEFSDHGAIARGQMALEDAAIAAASDVVILDTDLFSTVVYCEHYFGRCPEWIAETARSRAAHLYLLMQPDIPWIADGVRDRGEQRDEMHALFRARLQAFGVHVVEIAGDRTQRIDRALAAIRELQSRAGS
jgi:NadR type nicotinamide-nucleotide adenylyltransferase